MDSGFTYTISDTMDDQGILYCGRVMSGAANLERKLDIWVVIAFVPPSKIKCSDQVRKMIIASIRTPVLVKDDKKKPVKICANVQELENAYRAMINQSSGASSEKKSAKGKKGPAAKKQKVSKKAVVVQQEVDEEPEEPEDEEDVNAESEIQIEDSQQHSADLDESQEDQDASQIQE